MKKMIMALSVAFLLTSASFAQEAVFASLDTVEEIPKVDLEPVSQTSSQSGSVEKTTTSSIQEESFKKAITNLDDASAEIREQLINYNSQLSAAKVRSEQAKAEVKELQKCVNDTKKKLKNIEKSKKYINSNFQTESK